MFWLKDPKTSVPSVSLTFAVYTLVLSSVLGVFQAVGKIESVGPFVEMFWGCAALYLGRRISIGSKNFSSDNPEESKQKSE